MAAEAVSRGDFALAEAALREEIRRSPSDFEVHLGLVNALKARGFRDARVEAARRAAGVAPKDARAHIALASALAACGQLEAARASYEFARTLAPRDARVLTALGEILERLRRVDEARDACAKAIEIDPAFGPAYNLLGQLDAVAGDDAAAEKWLDRAIRASAQPEVKSTAWHRLGEIRERQGRYDDAFACHTTANGLLLDTPAAHRAAGTPVFHQLPHLFVPGTESMVERWAARRFEDRLPDPVFLVGFPRSGTTLAESILAAIPGAVTSDEEPVLNGTMRSALAMCAARGAPPTPQTLMGALDGLSDAQVGELRREYWRSVGEMVSPVARRATVFVDKTPLRILHLAYVSLLFPRARIVCMVRDPRDCCLSCYTQDFAINAVLVRFLTQESTGDAYAAVMDFWLRVRGRIPNPLLEVRYEDLARDFEPTARRMVEFLGAAWSEEIGRFQERAAARTIRTPSYRAVTERVSDRAIGRWKRYERHIGPMLERVGPFVEPLGYASEG